jgi:hypothetical protein
VRIKLWIEAKDIIGYSVTHHKIMDKKEESIREISLQELGFEFILVTSDVVVYIDYIPIL